MSCGYPAHCSTCDGTGLVGPELAMARWDERGQPLPPLEVSRVCPACNGDGELCPGHPAAAPRVCLVLDITNRLELSR